MNRYGITWSGSYPGGSLPHAEEIVGTESGQTLEPSSRAPAWLILCLLFFLTVIMFIARLALSVMAPVLRTVFHLTNAAYGRIVSALGFGMMTGEFPMGYLMDRLGARLGLTAAIAWWSTATASFALAGSGLSLGLSQYWKGTGECGAYTGGVKTITRLFEKKDRTLAIGIFNGGSVIGATLAVPVIVYLLQHYGFRVAFLVPSIAGFLWIPTWWFMYGKEPKIDGAGWPAFDLRTRTPRQLFHMGRHALPLLRRACHAVLLVLDAHLSLSARAT